MYSVRGAITIDEDIKDEINLSTKELITSIIKENNINIDDIISIIFSCTNDIISAYPAEAARQMGIKEAGLLCLQEMYVKDSMKKCIRILMHVNGYKKQSDVKHIFLRDAVILREDITRKSKGRL